MLSYIEVEDQWAWTVTCDSAYPQAIPARLAASYYMNNLVSSKPCQHDKIFGRYSLGFLLELCKTA